MISVPVENIYYLLCYAWNKLDERDLVNVSCTDSTNLLNLFARVLGFGTSHLLRRGLDRGYVSIQDELRLVRGHVDMSSSIKRGILPICRLACEYDEMSYDVLHNRILKTTIGKLRNHGSIEKENQENLTRLYRRLHEIREIELANGLFSKVRLHRNNAFYGFLMNICLLIYINVLAKEGEGDYLFQDFIRNQRQMGLLFEQFVLNFFKLEVQPHYDGCKVVGSEYINWDILADEEASPNLPQMKTDISIQWPGRYQIIDTKFYSKTFQTYHEKDTVHSSNLYQLFSYLKNIEKRGPRYKDCEGMLLYPTTTKEVSLDYVIQGHLIKIRTINLNQPWQAIHQRLMSIALAQAS